jgi:hypothetical protein
VLYQFEQEGGDSAPALISRNSIHTNSSPENAHHADEPRHEANSAAEQNPRHAEMVLFGIQYLLPASQTKPHPLESSLWIDPEPRLKACRGISG